MLGHRQAHGQADDQIQDEQQQVRQPPARQRHQFYNLDRTARFNATPPVSTSASEKWRPVRAHLFQLISSLLGFIT